MKLPLIVLPAAGFASRMRGGDKLVEQVGGMPLLRRQAIAALSTGCPVVVTLPTGEGTRRDALRGIGVRIEVIQDASEGMAASLRSAAGLLTDGQGMGLLLPDVPGVGAAEISAVLKDFLASRGSRPVRAADPENRPGTPLFLPYRIARRFAGLTGDEGGRALLAGEDVALVIFPDDRATRDLDTPEAWAAWRAESGISE